MKMSDLMASSEASLPERIVKICVSGKLLAELGAADKVLVDLEADIMRLENEKRTLEAEERESDGEFKPGRRRMVEKPRAAVIAERLAGLNEQARQQAEVVDEIRGRMLEHSVDVVVRAKEPGEWQQFLDANPPREKDDDRAGYTRDLRHASLVCNIDALRAAAGDWIVRYGDEAATPEMWEWLAGKASRGDQLVLANAIVSVHEGTVDPGKSRRDWLATRHDEAASK